MYIRKQIANFLEKMPLEMSKPRHWKKFMNENSVEYNLIIKHGSEYECTNCGKYFYSTQVEGRRCWEICPFCHNKYDVRRSNLKNYFFLYDLAFIDNVDNKVVIRYFEIKRDYDYKKRRFSDDIVEYARIVPELDLELVSDRFSKYMCSERVYHTKRIKRWRIYTGRYGLRQYYKSIYLDDMKEKLKGTIYEYAPLVEAINYVGNNKIDFLKLLEKAKYPSFELLMKMGLYKLAIECPERFNGGGSFEKRFGVNKTYYNFMKKHNISYDELCILKKIKRANIAIIRDILKMSDRISDIETVSTYIDLIKLKEYSKKQKSFSIYSYLDYIRNLQKLDIPLTKKMLLPENFIEAHDESVKKVKVISSDVIKEKIKHRYIELEKNKYNDNIFLIRPAKSMEDMKNEAKQQNNCVYKNYSDKYAFGETDIYFMREIKNPKKSLVTVEVNNGTIRQKYQKHNQVVTKEQNKFLKQWEQKILKVA